jgi:membrane protein YqaA with SNARE-associated domain
MTRLTLLIILASWSRLIFRFFRRLGPLGLFLLGALDSSFLFLPFGNDLLLIALVSSNRSGASWMLYVLMSALGSVAGVLMIDLIMRKAGEEGLKRFLKPKRLEQLRVKMNRNAGWAVFVATLVPPPFPFTPVIMAAAALQCSRYRIVVAVFVGRLIRYTFEALLAIYFGRALLRYVNSPLVEYFVYALIAIAVVGSTLSIWKWLGSRGQKSEVGGQRAVGRTR